MITDEKRDKCLTYLATTDESCAQAKARVKALEYQLKTVKAMGFLHAEGSVAERESIAYTTPEFTDKVKEYKEAVEEFEIMDNKRKTAELIIEVWRSENSNRRAGIV